ncbi:MAG: DUF4340 domain-containing protein [Verrucomicrobiaceae bacterium]|nr:MAG: DUF4340 domain-containing protein [Verrucomicrobiaceae bacterium]
MNKRQVIILWAIAIGLGASVTAVKISQNKAVKTSTERKSGETLFSSFPATDVSTVEIQGAGNAVTLTKKDGKWVVVERGNYPANPNFINELIRTLGDLKITQAMEAGPSFAPRFGMDDSATKPEEHGLTATFKDASGKEVAKVGLGKNIENSSAPAAGMPPGMGGGSVGRYVRNYADTTGFYAVGEMFPSVSADAKHWLSDSFINPEKITSVAVFEPDSDEVEWQVSRASEEAEFQLDGAKEGEVADSTATAPLKSLFSFARFEDVVPQDKVEGLILSDSTRSIVIGTAEGFRYTITLSALKAGTPAASKETPAVVPPPSGNCLVTVEVTASLPKERKKEEGEKPEDAKAKDDAFAERHKALTEKLAKEQALSGITFEVGASTVEPLMKDRKTLTTKPAPPAEGADQGSVQQLPGGMIARPPVSATTPPIQAVTPPISVPPAGSEAEGPSEDDVELTPNLPDGRVVEPADHEDEGDESSGEE